MKHSYTVLALLALCLVMACTKESGIVSNTASPVDNAAGSQYGIYGHSTSRLSGSQYSQSIKLDTANKMLQSYLNSVGYPAVDTAIRSLSFDADTLRAYLQNPNITTLKFMFAHQPAYMNNGGNGVQSGMKPNALTMIIVGLNDDQHYVLNNRNEVYEHFVPCPSSCPNSINDAYVHY